MFKPVAWIFVSFLALIMGSLLLLSAIRTNLSSGDALRAFQLNLAAETKGLLSTYLTLKALDYDGAYYGGVDELERLREELRGKALWDFSSGEIKGRLLRSVWIKDARVSFNWLKRGLRIELKEAEPFLVLELPSESWLVSTDGELLDTLSAIDNAELILKLSTLVRLRVPHELGSPTELAKFRQGFALLVLLEKYWSPPFRVDYYSLPTLSNAEEGQQGSSRGLLITPAKAGSSADSSFSDWGAPAEKVQVYAETEKELQEKLTQLETVLSDLKKRGEKAEFVDLSYGNRAIITGLGRESK